MFAGLPLAAACSDEDAALAVHELGGHVVAVDGHRHRGDARGDVLGDRARELLPGLAGDAGQLDERADLAVVVDVRADRAPSR